MAKKDLDFLILFSSLLTRLWAMIYNETSVETRKKTTWFMMALWNFPEDRRAPVKVEVGLCAMAERKE